MFRADPRHTGIYLTQGVEQTPEILWKFKTSGRVMSTPAVSDDLVFFGSDDGFLYAVDLPTGSEAWKFETAGEVRSSPAVADGMVFFGSYDGNFYALDVNSGAERWRFETAGERRWRAKHLDGIPPADRVHVDLWDFYQSSPVLADGYVFFGTGEGTLYALNAITGEPLWTLETGDTIHSSPAVTEGTLYVGNMESRLYAVDTETGEVIWRFQAGTDEEYFNQHGLQSSPTVSGGVVYVGGRDGGLHAIDSGTGEELWKYDTNKSWVLGSPAIQDAKVYFATSDTMMLVAANALTGETIFETSTRTYTYSSPVIVGNTVYVGTCGGVLFAFDSHTGSTRWEFRTEASELNREGILQTDGTWDYEKLFAGDWTYDNVQAAVERFLDLGAFLSSPVLHNGVVYIGSADGHLYSLGEG